MLHELLFALCGQEGDVFQRVPVACPEGPVSLLPAPSPPNNLDEGRPRARTSQDGEEGVPAPPGVKGTRQRLAIPEDYPFLHPAERASLEQLADLGQQYHHLLSLLGDPAPQAAAATAGQGPGKEGEPSQTGRMTSAYRPALYAAIDAIPLARYRATVVEMERRLVDMRADDCRGAHTPLAVLSITFAKDKVLFPHLIDMVEELHASLAAGAAAGVGAAAPSNNTADAGRYAGCRVLDLLYERTLQTGIPAVRKVMEELLQAVLQTVFYPQLYAWLVCGRVVDAHGEFFVRPLPAGDDSASAKGTAREMGPTAVQPAGGAQGNKWDDSFVLCPNSVPCFLGTTTAASILFVGKAVSTLSLHLQQRPNGVTPPTGSVDGSGPDSFQSLAQMPLPPALFATPFRLLDFQGAVMEARAGIATRLWATVVVEEQLASMLNLFKDYYLLGRGDMFTEFLLGYEGLKQRATARLALVTAHELNVLLRRSQAEDQHPHVDHHQPLLFHFVEHAATGSSRFPFALQARISWPLDLVFCPRDVAQYNQLFAWLLGLRQTQMMLERALKGPPTWRRRGGFAAWTLRQDLLFFLTCFQSYLMMDVIEPQHAALLDTVHEASATCDFEALAAANQATLQRVVEGCLMESECVWRCVEACERGAMLLREGGAASSSPQAMADLCKQFKRDMLLLYQSLTGLSRHQPLLNQLLLRLDFNRSFSLAALQASTAAAASSSGGRAPSSPTRKPVRSSIPKPLWQ